MDIPQVRVYGRTLLTFDAANEPTGGYIDFELRQARLGLAALRLLADCLPQLLAQAEFDARRRVWLDGLPSGTGLIALAYQGHRRVFFIRTDCHAWEFSAVEAYQVAHELRRALDGRPEFRYGNFGPQPVGADGRAPAAAPPATA